MQERSHATLLVGRTRELDLLSGALERARADRQPQLVTLVGVPGIGKSRLVHELKEAATADGDLVTWRQGRCLPYGDGTSLAAFAEILEQQLEISESDSEEVVAQKLGAAVADDWIRGHLRVLVGLAPDVPVDADRRQEAFSAWRTYLEQVAGSNPLVVVVEDIHWADDVLLDFLDYLVDWASGVSLLVVATTRPELLERRSSWGGGKTNASTVSLGALSDDETARLLGRLLGRSAMPAEEQAVLLARAGGNPLYAEQFARLLDEHGESLVLPETVQGLIAARLDMLASDEKALLQDAAVVGPSFWLGALRAISGIDPRAAEIALHALARKGFVVREHETAITGDPEYTFQHVVVQEVAYGQIPRAPRSDKHRLTAEWIASLAGREADVDMLAHHYGQALVLARAAGEETSHLESPARAAFRGAADRAFDMNAYASAARLYEQALDLCLGSDPERAELLFRRARAVLVGLDDTRSDLFEEARDALLAAGQVEDAAEAETLGAFALRAADRVAEALVSAQHAVGLVESLPASRQKAYVQANYARLLVVAAFRYEEPIAMAREALANARELELHDLEAHCLNTIGTARVMQWDVDGLADAEESLRIGLEHCPPFEVFRIYNNLQSSYVNAGRLADAYATARAALEMARRFGLPFGDFERQVVFADFDCGRWDAAAERIEKLGDAGTTRDPFDLGVIAELRLARDDLAGAIAACDEAVASVRAEPWSHETAHTLLSFLGFRARIALAAGDEEMARQLADELLAIELDVRQMYPAPLVELALVLVDLDMVERAPFLSITAERVLPWHEVVQAITVGRFVDAADRLAEIGAVTLEASTRMLAAERLVADGRQQEAEAQLERALTFYRSVGATRYIRQAQALRAKTA